MGKKLCLWLVWLFLSVSFSPLLTGCTTPETRHSTGQFLDDSAITTKIKAKLLDDPTVSGLAISVETYKGDVQLTGFANSNIEIKQAERLARETSGVKAVLNNIYLKQ